MNGGIVSAQQFPAHDRIAVGAITVSLAGHGIGQLLRLDEPSLPRRETSRVALATWNSHVHIQQAQVHALAPRHAG